MLYLRKTWRRTSIKRSERRRWSDQVDSAELVGRTIARAVSMNCCIGGDILRRQRVQWAGDAARRLLHDVCIDHGRANIIVAEQFLHGPNVLTAFEQVRG